MVVWNSAVGFAVALGAAAGLSPGMATVTEIILTGVRGLSSRVGTLEILTQRSSDAWSTTFPKTGCFDSPPVNQSRFLLLATLRKNWLPPLFFAPVLAMDSVPGAFDVRSMFSSLMLPPLNRFSVSPVAKFLKVVPSLGPPVPERCELGSLEKGQPNWFMKPGITRWK